MESESWEILLVDDDDDDYTLMGDMLTSIAGENARLHWASTYQAGLDMLFQRPWDILLIDYDLGKKNGLEFIREALARGSRTPMVMVTGRGSYELDVEAVEVGADDYISKDQLTAPFLERVIRLTLERRLHRQRLEETVEKRTRLLQAANADLQQALEALRVMDEELRYQNEGLVEGRQRLEDERQEYWNLFDLAPAALLTTDQNGVIRKVNRAAAALLAPAKNHLHGKPLSFYVDMPQRKDLRNTIRRALSEQTHAVKTGKLRLKPRQAPAYEALLTVTPKTGPSGEVHELLWLIERAGSRADTLPGEEHDRSDAFLG